MEASASGVRVVRLADTKDLIACRKGLAGVDLDKFDKTHVGDVRVDIAGREFIWYNYDINIDTFDVAYLAEDFPVCDEAEDNRWQTPGKVELQPELPGVESTLAERGARYGSFAREASTIQQIRRLLFTDDACLDIPDDCKQAAEMIVVKLVRAMRGDPNYADNWHDISGYATLVEKRINADLSWVGKTH